MKKDFLCFIQKKVPKIIKTDIFKVVNSNKLIKEDVNINIDDNVIPGKYCEKKDMNSNKNNINKGMKNIININNQITKKKNIGFLMIILIIKR